MTENYYANNATEQEKIACGLIKNKQVYYAFGRNTVVGTTEVIVANGGVYGLPTTAETVTPTSNDIGDVVDGAGAWTIEISGLDGNYNMISEVVDMDSPSILEYIRVFNAKVVEAGDVSVVDGGNIGLITITQDTSTTEMLTIPIGNSRNLSACFTVPAGYVGLMYDADTTTGSGKDAVLKLKSRVSTVNAPFVVKGVRGNYQNSVGQKFTYPTKYEEKEDILFTAKSSAAGTSVSASFQLVLIKM